MMNTGLSGSVGNGGANSRDDVIAVQSLLASHGFKLGRPDGIVGPKTLRAIRSFQQPFMRTPDGRVDPDGLTWRRLSAKPTVPASKPPTSPFLRLLPRPEPGTVNVGLIAVSNQYMASKLGQPRESYSTDCQPVTNAHLKGHMIVTRVGPLHVQGLAPATESLRQVLTDIAREQPDVYAVLGTAGMLCCRFQRGSNTKISNHSWGTAIDLTIAGALDTRGDGKTQYGLTLIAPIFNRYGWYWGAVFPTEDSMHFEGSQTLIDQWAASLT